MRDDGIGSRDQQREVGAVVKAAAAAAAVVVVVGGMHLDTPTWDSDSGIVDAYCSYRTSQRPSALAWCTLPHSSACPVHSRQHEEPVQQQAHAYQSSIIFFLSFLLNPETSTFFAERVRVRLRLEPVEGMHRGSLALARGVECA